MEQSQHTTIFRKDYQPSAYLAKTLNLDFSLNESFTIVRASTFFERNSKVDGRETKLVLNGEQLELLSIAYNGRILAEKEFTLHDTALIIEPVDDAFCLEITTKIFPARNTALEGLYQSNSMYCTQCEAEGFRKITFALDRPDVLSVYTTRIEGECDRYPVLLSNGNLVDQGKSGDGRQYAIWHDPFPKPSYLFALVAGRLENIEDSYTTRSGRKVCLRIFVEPHNIGRCDHAMQSLKKSMKWDEDVFGLEYDLDIFMIVAVDDFNMGAMENKGLNIFNAKNIVVSPETATDADYMAVEAVVAHEYFHNWTGNRVTCRDWFQLSLKEGLTVYRDQEFSADMNSRPVQRIQDVRNLRTFQFREDAGPMAHPIRPDSYVEINNFYTATVYNKGAEVIRMMKTVLGAEGFRKGMDLYIDRHDGEAATCDDFVAAMADANSSDLSLFSSWYSQSGTPVLDVWEKYQEDKKSYSLTIEQSCPATPGQAHKKPFIIPITIGLLDENGGEINLSCKNGLLELTQIRQTFSFPGVQKRPVVSFLRDFSAPVIVKPFQSQVDLLFLLEHDPNLFNRWEAANKLAENILLAGIADIQNNSALQVGEAYTDALYKNICSKSLDKSLLSLILQLPAELYLAGKMEVIDPDALHLARKSLQKVLSSRLGKTFQQLYDENCDFGVYQNTPEATGRRSLKNVALYYLMIADSVEKSTEEKCLEQYTKATNMTDRLAAFTCIEQSSLPYRDEIIQDFYDRWKHNPLVMDKWFTVQAVSTRTDSLTNVKNLLSNPLFSLKNPNKVRALIGAFCSGNHAQFHDIKGSGYTFLADHVIALNTLNPQIAARLLSPFLTWKKYDATRQDLMRTQLEKILAVPCISKDVYEVVSKSLK